MEESILTSIKKLLGIDESFTAFDQDIIMHINSVLATMFQEGIIPDSTIAQITGTDETWLDLIDTRKDISMVKSYIYLKVRMLFDPPTSTALMESMKAMASEYEWRMYTMDNVYCPEETDTTTSEET